MKSLILALAVALSLLALPAWAAGSGSFHAMAKVSAASTLNSDELSAVEGGVVEFGNSVLLQVHEHSLGTFLGYVLQQQYGTGPFPPIVVNTTISATAQGSGVFFEAIHTISPLTLVCSHCIMP